MRLRIPFVRLSSSSPEIAKCPQLPGRLKPSFRASLRTSVSVFAAAFASFMCTCSCCLCALALVVAAAFICTCSCCCCFVYLHLLLFLLLRLFALALVFAVASEIGPGFSPDITSHPETWASAPGTGFPVLKTLWPDEDRFHSAPKNPCQVPKQSNSMTIKANKLGRLVFQTCYT